MQYWHEYQYNYTYIHALQKLLSQNWLKFYIWKLLQQYTKNMHITKNTKPYWESYNLFFEPSLTANLALQKPAAHNPQAAEKGKASLAVDGDMSPNSCSKTGMSTLAGDLWWRVDMERQLSVEKVEIIGASCCSKFQLPSLLLIGTYCMQVLLFYWSDLTE